MTILFCFYSFVFSLFFYFFILKKKKTLTILFSFSIFNIFYSPVLYYYFGGDSYSNFDYGILNQYMLYGLAIVFLFVFSYVFTSVIKFKRRIYFSLSDSVVSRMYFFCIILMLTLYYAYFFKSFPLIHFIINDELIERPDLTGNIPFFYTVSTLVAVILPSAYFYYFNNIDSKWHHLFVNMVIVFFFVASGHKGLIVYYFLFVWIYIMRYKVNLYVLAIVVLVFTNYLIAKGITELNVNTLEYMLSSPFRRFFVTQGAGHIHRMDMLFNDGYNYISANPRGIKFDVFEHMYGAGLVGSAPTFFTGDILVKYGTTASLIAFFIVASFLFTCSRWLTSIDSDRNLFLYWNFYFSLYLICMAEFSAASSMRIIFTGANISIALFLFRRKIAFH